MSKSVYFDNAASTPLLGELVEYIADLNGSNFANPSSIHSEGLKARALLNDARKFFAGKLNAEPEEIFFSSSATEANNLVIQGFFSSEEEGLIITSPSEHPCVIEAIKVAQRNSKGKLEVQYLNLDSEGFISLDELEGLLQKACAESGGSSESFKVLVSIMHGNNEIGTLQDIEAIGNLSEKYNAHFHTDAVQTFSKLPIDVQKMNIDFLVSSGHKLHAPKGTAFLYKRKGLKLDPMIYGGGQENDLRSGTENVNGVLAFQKAIELGESRQAELRELYSYAFEELSKIPGIIINGPKDISKRVPGNINISFGKEFEDFYKLNSEQVVLQMDLAGFAVGTGSACSSNKLQVVGMDGKPVLLPSYVLRACKLPEEVAANAVRISLSYINTRDEIDAFVAFLKAKALTHAH